MNRRCNRCGDDLTDEGAGLRCPRCLLALAVDYADDDFPGSTNAELVPGQRFGNYELIREIARGGMGVVYMAKQVALNRIVALKVILSGQFATRQEVLRFRAEAEAVANLRHPNIVAIYETGEEDGHHFFSMEYVEGRNLADIVRDGPLPAERSAAYCETIARAIHCAHLRGTVHRDLKPSNVLIDLAGNVRVTDFGLARPLSGGSDLTVTGQMLGSPSFMPPEQASGRNAAVGPAYDVYGIGAILYHLLTGNPPFQGATMAEVVRQLQEQDPVPPRLLVPGIPRDLQTVALKCLEKDPAKRYSSADQLADELGRFLCNEPILARPAGAAEKVWRWCRRKPAVATLLTALWLAILLGIGGVLWQWRQATENARALRHGLYSSDINLASRLRADKDVNRAAIVLRRHVPKTGEEDLRGFEWRYLWASCRGQESQSVLAHTGNVHSVVVMPKGDYFLTTGGDRTAKLWNLRTFGLERVLKQFTGTPSLNSLAVSADGGRVAACDGEAVTVWESTDWSEIKVVAEPAVIVAFVPQTGALATSSGNAIKVWNPSAWTSRDLVEGPLELFAFSPDGRVLAVARKEILELHEATTGNLLVQLPGTIEDHAYSLAFSPDNRFVAAGGMYGGVVVWEVASAKILARLKPHSSFVSGLAFSPDGQRLATGGSDQYLTVGRVADWHKEVELYGHDNGIFSLAFTLDGRFLLSASRDQTVKSWKIPTEPKEEVLGDSQALIGFLPDSRTAVTLDTDATLRLWDVASLRETSRLKVSAQLKAMAGIVTPDGETVAIGFDDGSVELRRLANGELLDRASGGTNAIFSLQFSPDGTSLASVGISLRGGPTTTGILKLWSVSDQGRLTALAEDFGGWASGIAFSHDSRLLAVGLPDHSILLWDRVRHQPMHTLAGHTWHISSVAFSPDDRTLASSSWDTSVRLWDRDTGRERTRFSGLPVGAGAVAFSPDGRTLAASFVGNAVQFWHVANQQELMTLNWSGRFIGQLIFSPDGTTLGAGRLLPVSPDGGVQLWRASSGDAAELPGR
jgi:eukaryotic-like serine/threonine-protein kinase